MLARRYSMIRSLAAALVVAGGVGSVGARAAETVDVVATTGMIADAVREVGGDLVSVKALMGPGVDPHSYRQTRSDIVAMAQADLVLWHGLYLEAQLENFMNQLSAKQEVHAVADGLPKDQLVQHDDYADKYDPHVWMDPDLWSGVVASVRDALVEIDPEHAAIYAANADKYFQDLDALAEYADDALSGVPEESRVLVTAHDAFNYFGNAYGFDVVGIQGISTESEAGLKRISELVDLLVERDVHAVFVETSVSDRNIRALIEGAAARGHQVEIGGELYSDAMGAPGTYEGTYIGMIDHNTTAISQALGGDAPNGGMSGLLSES